MSCPRCGSTERSIATTLNATGIGSRRWHSTCVECRYEWDHADEYR